MTGRYRQEVFNVYLAQLLQDRGIVSAPETILRGPGPDHQRRMPDILVNYQGLRTAIEGEVGDNPNAQFAALASARSRVEIAIAHIGVAVIYPKELRSASPHTLKGMLASSKLHIAIVTESEETGFVPGDVNYLADALRHAFEHLVREDVVTQAVLTLDAGIEGFAKVVSDKAGVVGRIARTLGIHELDEGKK